MNGDEIRAAKFVRSSTGYDASEVDGLLRLVAAELDADRPAGPLIENATFRTGGAFWRHYDIDSVDWFLDQLLLHPGRSELAGLSSDPWRDLAVAQGIQGRVREPATQPGTYLWWETIRSGAWDGRRTEYELRTADHQVLASIWPGTVTACGRTFTFSRPEIPARSTADSWPPGIAELAARSWRDRAGHFTAETMKNSAQRMEARGVREVVDETGTPILYLSGMNFDRRACARITFPDQRWLRFLIRGTKRATAVMTAMDQAGNKVARYRNAGRRLHPGQTVEIAVHPDRELTDELILAIALSTPWLAGYFYRQ